MDSYYLSKKGRDDTTERGGNVIAAIHKNRFRSVCELLEKKVCQAGESSTMYNEKTHKAIVHHWSRESTVGKKLVYSTAFNRIDKKNTSGGVAVY